jgi:hypothetical protein
MCENLMIAVAILESGGSVIEGHAPPKSEMADLTAFSRSLEEAARLFLD